jgi:hypothetical protein
VLVDLDRRPAAIVDSTSAPHARGGEHRARRTAPSLHLDVDPGEGDGPRRLALDGDLDQILAGDAGAVPAEKGRPPLAVWHVAGAEPPCGRLGHEDVRPALLDGLGGRGGHQCRVGLEQVEHTLAEPGSDGRHDRNDERRRDGHEERGRRARLGFRSRFAWLMARSW